MAFINADRVKETTTTTGLGTYSLAGAAAGFRTFVAGVGTANQCHYVVENGTDWEVGIGTVTDAAPDTLSRDVILASSNAGAAVNWGAGTKNVFCAGLASAGQVWFNDLTPAQITLDQNDYAPAGIVEGTTVLRLSTDQPRSITGIAGGRDGRILTVVNVSANVDGDLVLRNEHTGSLAANRLAFGFDVVLEPNEAVALIYDATASRWRFLTSRRWSGGTFRRNPFWATDFLGEAVNVNTEAVTPWDVSVFLAGTQTKIAGLANHPGILRFTSSTTADSGGRVRTATEAFIFGGGEVAEFVFRIVTLTNLTFRLGFQDLVGSADAADGAYIEVPSTGAAVGKTANNSVRTTSATIATLAIDTWYIARIKVNRDATAVDFEILDDAGNLLGSVQITTNIPTAAGREFGHGYVATNAGTVATALVEMDYMSIEFTRALV